MMHRFVLCAAFVVAALTLLPAVGAVKAEAAQKVGFVNPQRVINESRLGSMAQEDLTRLGAEKDKAIRESAEAVNSLQAELDNTNLTQAERRLKEDKLQALYREHEKLVQRSQEDVKIEEARLIQFIMKKADGILKELARKYDYSIILTDPNAIGYIDESVDLTDKVIEQLNKQEKK